MPKLKAGLLLVDKPIGISSFGVVARVRRASGIRKVGHAGTLDPLASGLMIILLGQDYTRQADSYLKLDKTYQVELTLGKISSSGDGEGPITKHSNKKPTTNQVKKVLRQFIGEITQTPPRHSAIKINGQRAYTRARKNEQFLVPERQVEIFAITAEHYNYPQLNFRVQVSSGTYIRSLGADIGLKLGTGAYVSGLRRTKIGTFSIEKATTLEKIAQMR